jgi:hypothetical protein
MRNYFELNENENTTSEYLWDAANKVIEEKISTYETRKTEQIQSQINRRK